MIKQKIEERYIKMKRGLPVIYDGKTEKELEHLKESLDHADEDITSNEILKNRLNASNSEVIWSKLQRLIRPTSSIFNQTPLVHNLSSFHDAVKKHVRSKLEFLKNDVNDPFSKEEKDLQNDYEKHFNGIANVIDDHLKTNFYANGLKSKINDYFHKNNVGLLSKQALNSAFHYAIGHDFHHDTIQAEHLDVSNLKEEPKTLKEVLDLNKKYGLTPESTHLYKNSEGFNNIVITKNGPKKLIGYATYIKGYHELKDEKVKQEKSEIEPLHNQLSSIPNDDVSHNNQAVIRDYSGTLSGPVNRHILRRHMNSEFLNSKERRDYRDYSKHEMDDKVDQISEGLKKNHSFDRDFHVYSGMASRVDIHKIIEENGNKTTAMKLAPFTSTSLSKSTAIQFASSKIPHSKDYHNIDNVMDVLKIHVPKDHTRGRYLEHDLTQNESEYEYLLDKDHIVHVHPEPEIDLDKGFVRVWNAYIHKNGNMND